jgi:hypothetical protein
MNSRAILKEKIMPQRHREAQRRKNLFALKIENSEGITGMSDIGD